MEKNFSRQQISRTMCVSHVILVLLPFLFLYPTETFSQTIYGGYEEMIKNICPSSPQVTMMNRFGNHPVDYSTGITRVSIPLYTVESGSLTLPISIDYHASGIKVQDIATPVGLGWSLTYGGAITKTQLGGIDRNHEYKYTNKEQIEKKIKASETTDSHEWDLLGGNSLDNIESDRFNFSFCGESGVFRYSIKDHCYRTIPYSDIKIEDYSGGFKITKADGVAYYFNVIETGGPQGSVGNHSWLLTKIEPLNKCDSITFKYTLGQPYVIYGRYCYTHIGDTYVFEDRLYPPNYYTWAEYKDLKSDNSSYTGFNCSNLLISQICWHGNHINFEYVADRKDYGNRKLQRLTSLKVYNYKGDIIRKAEFQNNKYLGTSTDNFRMLLESVKISGQTSSDAPERYSFKYNEKPLPDYTLGRTPYCHEDYFGYYNGTSSNGWIPREYAFAESADRSINSSYVAAGILTEIYYPTGGRSVFEYECNKDGSRLWGGLRIKSICSYEGNQLLRKIVYSYENAVISKDITESLYKYQQWFYYFNTELGVGQYVGDTMCSLHTVAVSEPNVSLNGDFGGPIYYKKVTEKTMKGNDVVKTRIFSYSDTYTDEMKIMMGRDNFDDIIRYNSTYYNAEKGIIKPLLISESITDGRTNYKKEYKYQEVKSDILPLGVRFCHTSNKEYIPATQFYNVSINSYEFNDYYAYSDVLAYTNFLRLQAVVEEKDGQSTTTQYFYDESKKTLPIKVIKKASKGGEENVITYRYSFQDKKSVPVEMGKQHIYIPILTTNFIGGKVISKDSIGYAKKGTSFLPVEYYHGSNTGLLEKRMQVTYDGQNNIIGIEKDQLLNTIFVWGCNSMYPVMRIDGISLSTLKSYIGESQYNSLFAGNPTAACLKQVRSSLSGKMCHVYTYEYTPLVGVTTITDQRNFRSVFSYDSMGRLKSVYEKKESGTGPLIERYSYSTSNQ